MVTLRNVTEPPINSTPPAGDPKPLGLETSMIPPAAYTVPPNVFVPFNNRAALPNFVKPPNPVTCASRLRPS
jgi:hypothetical protein